MTLAQSVADVLRHAIFQGAYLAGERLVELMIAQEMNVSQNTVREAFRLLEQDGLVVKRAHYGTYIRSHTRDEATELYALWAAIETLALDWALAQITVDQLSRLDKMVDQMRACLLADRDREALEIRFQFHATLADIAARPQTIAILRRLWNQFRLLENLRQTRAKQTLEQQNAQIRHYQALVEALHHKDHEQAQAHLQTCIMADREAVTALLE